VVSEGTFVGFRSLISCLPRRAGRAASLLLKSTAARMGLREQVEELPLVLANQKGPSRHLV